MMAWRRDMNDPGQSGYPGQGLLLLLITSVHCVPHGSGLIEARTPDFLVPIRCEPNLRHPDPAPKIGNSLRFGTG